LCLGYVRYAINDLGAMEKSSSSEPYDASIDMDTGYQSDIIRG